MDRTALLRRASEVRRRIFASLPWGIRFASVLNQIAAETGHSRTWGVRFASFLYRLALDATTIHNWGRALGAEFLLAGVEGMPDPGPRWNPNSKSPALTLPSGYLATEMRQIYSLLTSGKHNFDEETAKDAIDMWIAKVHGGHVKIDKEKAKSGLSSALSYAKTGIGFEANEIRRKAPGGIVGIPKEKKKEVGRPESLEDVGDESKTLRREIEDPHALAKFQRLLSDRMRKEWMEYLAKHVHPDIEIYLDLLMEGHSIKEIIGWPNKGIPSKLPHWTQGGPQNWDQNYKSKIVPKSLEFLHSKGIDVDDLV